jgi:hypothetical protein
MHISDSHIVGQLHIDLTMPSPGTLRVDWSGRSNERDPQRLLAPIFDEALARAAMAEAPIEMHFEKLEQFNSSTITALIGFVRHAHAEGVPLTLYYDASLRWQALSFEALRVFERPDGLLTLKPIEQNQS